VLPGAERLRRALVVQSLKLAEVVRSPALQATLRAHLAPVREKFTSERLDELRRLAGVAKPVDLPPAYAQAWSDARESSFLHWVVDEVVPPHTASALVEWYTDRFILGGGQLDGAAEKDFRSAFAGRLKPAQIDRLIRWNRDGGA
jgi:hypothetical protein